MWGIIPSSIINTDQLQNGELDTAKYGKTVVIIFKYSPTPISYMWSNKNILYLFKLKRNDKMGV